MGIHMGNSLPLLRGYEGSTEEDELVIKHLQTISKQQFVVPFIHLPKRTTIGSFNDRPKIFTMNDLLYEQIRQPGGLHPKKEASQQILYYSFTNPFNPDEFWSSPLHNVIYSIGLQSFYADEDKRWILDLWEESHRKFNIKDPTHQILLSKLSNADHLEEVDWRKFGFQGEYLRDVAEDLNCPAGVGFVSWLQWFSRCSQMNEIVAKLRNKHLAIVPLFIEEFQKLLVRAFLEACPLSLLKFNVQVAEKISNIAGVQIKSHSFGLPETTLHPKNPPVEENEKKEITPSDDSDCGDFFILKSDSDQSESDTLNEGQKILN